MPQNSAKVLEARKPIDAGMPKNISSVDQEKLNEKWNEAARKRVEDVARETKTPDKATLILVYELHRFGRHWNGYVRKGKKLIPLMATPSLLTSAVDAVADKMTEEALRA